MRLNLGLKGHQLYLSKLSMTNKYESKIRFNFHDSLSREYH